MLNLGLGPALGPTRLHLDATGALLLLGFRQRDREHAVLKPGLNLLRLDRIRNPETALEGAVRALNKVVVLLLARALELLLVRGSAFHASTASSVNQTVRLPRWRRLASYARQFATLFFCLVMW